jgi:hypothetical protein
MSNIRGVVLRSDIKLISAMKYVDNSKLMHYCLHIIM